MYKLFYLDDELRQQEHFKRELGQLFFIEMGKNPFEAITRLKQEKFDAIISDLHMPIVNGHSFYEMLCRNNLENIPFFFSQVTSTKIQK